MRPKADSLGGKAPPVPAAWRAARISRREHPTSVSPSFSQPFRPRWWFSLPSPSRPVGPVYHRVC